MGSPIKDKPGHPTDAELTGEVKPGRDRVVWIEKHLLECDRCAERYSRGICEASAIESGNLNLVNVIIGASVEDIRERIMEDPSWDPL